jgi:hypothetical protein
MDKIDTEEIRNTLKNYPPCTVAKETGFTYRHVYRFLRGISDNPTADFINAMIDFINKNKEVKNDNYTT